MDPQLRSWGRHPGRVTPGASPRARHPGRVTPGVSPRARRPVAPGAALHRVCSWDPALLLEVSPSSGGTYSSQLWPPGASSLDEGGLAVFGGALGVWGAEV